MTLSRVRLQVDRRHDTVPMTFEPWLGASAGLALVILIGAQIARALANLLAGNGLLAPKATELVPSSIAILTGNAASGLTHPLAHPANSTLLIWCLAITESAALAGCGFALAKALTRWGPWRMLGMATRVDAQSVLGLARLRHQAAVIRPDLYGPRRNREPQTPAGFGESAEASAPTDVLEPSCEPVVATSTLAPGRSWQ